MTSIECLRGGGHHWEKWPTMGDEKCTSCGAVAAMNMTEEERFVVVKRELELACAKRPSCEEMKLEHKYIGSEFGFCHNCGKRGDFGNQ